jgi:hypothetical protein
MTHEEFTDCLIERIEIVPIKKSKDQDRGKGAVEQDQQNVRWQHEYERPIGTPGRRCRVEES